MRVEVSARHVDCSALKTFAPAYTGSASLFLGGCVLASPLSIASLPMRSCASPAGAVSGEQGSLDVGVHARVGVQRAIGVFVALQEDFRCVSFLLHGATKSAILHMSARALCVVRTSVPAALRRHVTHAAGQTAVTWKQPSNPCVHHGSGTNRYSIPFRTYSCLSCEPAALRSL